MTRATHARAVSRRLAILLFCGVGTAWFFAGCGDHPTQPPPPPPAPGTIQGTVATTTGTPLSAIQVQLLNAGKIVQSSKLTTGSGLYQFSGLTPGDYYVRVSALLGYAVSPGADTVRAVTVQSGQTAVVSISFLALTRSTDTVPAGRTDTLALASGAHIIVTTSPNGPAVIVSIADTTDEELAVGGTAAGTPVRISYTLLGPATQATAPEITLAAPVNVALPLSSNTSNALLPVSAASHQWVLLAKALYTESQNASATVVQGFIQGNLEVWRRSGSDLYDVFATTRPYVVTAQTWLLRAGQLTFDCDDASLLYPDDKDPTELGTRKALVLVHGIQLLQGFKGSNWYCGGFAAWQPDDKIFGTFGDLLAVIATAQLRQRYKLYFYKYPSFVSVERNGRRLAAQLHSAGLTQYPDAVILLAHSMGGLVSRQALTDPDVKYSVERLITLASPHAGVPVANPNLDYSRSEIRSCYEKEYFRRLAGGGDYIPPWEVYATLLPGFLLNLKSAGISETWSESKFVKDLLAQSAADAIWPKVIPLGGQRPGYNINHGALTTQVLIHMACATDYSLSSTAGLDDAIVPISSAFPNGLQPAPSNELFFGLDHVNMSGDGQSKSSPLINKIIDLLERGLANGTALVSGNGQSGPVSTTLLMPLVVKVTDGYGSGVRGVSVTFGVTEGGGSFGGQPQLTVQTNATGDALVSWTLGSGAGSNTATASASGLTGSPVTFQATGTSGPALAVSLAASPASGPAPLGVALTADVSGNATGPITYTFWWNCSDPGTSVSVVVGVCGDPTNAAIGAKFAGVLEDPKILTHSYAAVGSYSAKVIVERGSAAPVEKRVAITVTNLPDLSLSATIGSSYAPGKMNVQLPVTVVRTEGSLTQGTFVTARLYWSSDARWDASDTQLWQSNGTTPDYPNAILNSAGSVTVTATVNIPAAAPGTYYIVAVADPTNFYQESNENNNVAAYPVTLALATSTVMTARGWMGAALLGGKIYAVGGGICAQCAYFGYGETGANESFDPSTATWTIRAPLNGPVWSLGTAAIGGRLYAFGGTYGSYTQPNGGMEIYDPGTDHWTAAASSMGIPRWKPAVAVANGLIYAFGGGANGNGARAVNIVEAYDPGIDTWALRAPMPTARYGAAASAVGNSIYVIGGVLDCCFFGVQTGAVEAYDPVQDVWQLRTPMTVARWDLGAATVNGKVYAIGGAALVGSTVVVQNVVEEYDPIANSWATKAPMPTARTGLAVVESGGLIYAIGGYAGTTVLSVVEVYNPATDTWNGTPPAGPSVVLTATPPSISVGQSSTLTWSSTNTTSCATTWTTSTGTNGSQLVSPAVTTAYSITCMGASGSATASATVTVAANPVLTVTGSGTGSGSVTSQAGLSPAIACTITDGVPAATGCSVSYALGTPVSLTATPSQGSSFTGWSGSCTGLGSCSLVLDAATGVTASFSSAPVATVTVALGSGTISVGQATQASATLRDVNGNVLASRTVSWFSSNTAIATVSSSGLVRGVAAGGPVSITATSEGKTGSSPVTVTTVTPQSGTILTIQSAWLPFTDSDSGRVSVFGWADTAATGGDRRIGILRLAGARGDSIPTGEQFKYPAFGAITRCPNGQGYAMDLEFQSSGPGYRLWQVDLTTGELSNPLGGLGSAGAGGKGVALTCDANNRLVIGDKLSLRVLNPQTGRFEQDLFNISLDYFRGLAESASGVLYATMEDGQVPGLPMLLAIVDRTTGTSNPVRGGQYLGLANVTDLAWFGPRLFGVSRLTPFLGSNIVEIDPVAGTARIVRPIRF